MKAKHSKWAHAAMVAATTFLADVGAQAASGTLNLGRAALVGLLVGGAARIVGAYLAARVADEALDTPSTSTLES